MTYIENTDYGQIEFTIVRTKRKTIGIVIGSDGSVEVRAPRWVLVYEIKKFVREKSAWIVKTKKRMEIKRAGRVAYDWDKIKEENLYWIKGRGRRMLESKVNFWAQRIGVSYNRIAIKDMKTRWGSCSEKGNLNFCWKIFILPEMLADYLIVHELVHLIHMNHSKDFWNVVAEYLPSYKELRKLLASYS